MKAIFITYGQAYNQELIELLEKCGQRGFTSWEEIGGRGSVDGSPRYGNHAWPSMNNAVLTVVDDSKVAEIMSEIKKTDEIAPDLGLRAFVWNIEDSY